MKVQPGLPIGAKINVNLKDIHSLEIGTKVWILNRGRRPRKEIITDVKKTARGKVCFTEHSKFYEQGIGYTVFFDKASALHAYKKYRKIRLKRHLRYLTDDLTLYIALVTSLICFYYIW